MADTPVVDEANGLSSVGQPLSAETGTPVTPPREQDANNFSAATPSSRLADIDAKLPVKNQTLVERVVLTDGYDWVLKDPQDPKQVIERGLRVRGDIVAVPESEARRGEAGGFLGSETDLKRVLYGAEAVENALPTEEVIDGWTPAQVLAYLANHTTDIDRVEEIERSRDDKGRKEVLKAIKTVRDFQEG